MGQLIPQPPTPIIGWADFVGRLGLPTVVALALLAMIAWGGQQVTLVIREQGELNRAQTERTIAVVEKNTIAQERLASYIDALRQENRMLHPQGGRGGQ